MNPCPIELACFGACLTVPNLPGWEIEVDVDWPDQALVSLHRNLPESEGFLGAAFHLFQGGRFSGLLELVENFPYLSGKVGLPVGFGACRGLLFHEAVRLETEPGATRIALDRYTLLHCGDWFAVFNVWCSPGLHEWHGLELDSLREALVRFLETSEGAIHVTMAVA